MRKAVLHLKKSDPLMRAIIERVGPFRMEFGEPTFHSLAEAIVYQQLNGKAAVTIFNRFTALAGDPVTPKGILKLTAEQLRGVGLSKQKSSYLFDMAERAQRGELDFSKLDGMTDDEVIAHLTQVKGVGVWTAHMFLMFTLKRANILPTGDFGIRMAMHKHYLDRVAKGRTAPFPRKARRALKKRRKLRLRFPPPSRWKRLPSAGSPTAALLAGICGEVWTRRRSADQ